MQTFLASRYWESPLDCKDIKPVNPKGVQSWVFIGRTDAEAETPILWPPDMNSWLTWKDPDAGKDWGQEKKGMTEHEMVGWHHWLNGHVWVNSGSWWWTGKPGVLQSVHGITKSWTRLSDWTELMGPDAMILVFWMLSFKPAFSLSSFTVIKRLFSSSLSAIRVVSYAYLRLLIFLPAILIPACGSSSPAFLMMYSAYPTLSDLMDCSLPGSSFHGILQAIVLEWGAIAFSSCLPTRVK